MKDLTTRAFIFANGRDELIYPGIEGQVLNAASSGIPVVVLHHTGGAAEKLGLALQERKKHKAPMDPKSGRYQIPDNVNVDNFLLLSTSSDSVEKVIDKLTLVLSSVQDDEMREVGYLQAERQLMLQAWQMHTLFKYHARTHRMRARILYFSLLLLQFVITTISASWQLIPMADPVGSRPVSGASKAPRPPSLSPPATPSNAGASASVFTI